MKGSQSGLHKGGIGGIVVPANLRFCQPFWVMIHVLLLGIKLCLISRKVPASQNWLQDQSGFHPKVYDSQMCVPAKSGCRKKRIYSQNQSKFIAIQGLCYQPKLATCQEWMPAQKQQEQNGCIFN